jgi:hypothetical protein
VTTDSLFEGFQGGTLPCPCFAICELPGEIDEQVRKDGMRLRPKILHFDSMGKTSTEQETRKVIPIQSALMPHLQVQRSACHEILKMSIVAACYSLAETEGNEDLVEVFKTKGKTKVTVTVALKAGTLVLVPFVVNAQCVQIKSKSINSLEVKYQGKASGMSLVPVVRCPPDDWATAEDFDSDCFVKYHLPPAWAAERKNDLAQCNAEVSWKTVDLSYAHGSRALQAIAFELPVVVNTKDVEVGDEIIVYKSSGVLAPKKVKAPMTWVNEIVQTRKKKSSTRLWLNGLQFSLGVISNCTISTSFGYAVLGNFEK